MEGDFCGDNPGVWQETVERNGFGIDEREQQYVHVKCQPKNEKYANGSVGARVILMVREGCQPVRGFKGMEWKYGDDLCVRGTKETEMHVDGEIPKTSNSTFGNCSGEGKNCPILLIHY